MKKEKDKVKKKETEVNFKRKWASCRDLYYKKMFMMFAFCIEKGIDVKELLEFQRDLTFKMQTSQIKQDAVSIVGHIIPKKLLIKQLTTRMVKSLNAVQRGNDITFEISDNESIINLKKCQARKTILKYSKKTGISVPNEGNCLYCKKILERVNNLGLFSQITANKDGCIIRFGVSVSETNFS